MTITLYDTHLNLMVEQGTNNPQCAVGGFLGGKESKAGKLVLGIYPVQNCHDNIGVDFAYNTYDKKDALAYFAHNGILMLGTYSVSRSELSKRTLVNRRMYGYGLPKLLHIVLSENGNSQIYGYDITKRAALKEAFDEQRIKVDVIVRAKGDDTGHPENQKQQISENRYYDRKAKLFQAVDDIIEGKENLFDKRKSHDDDSSFHVDL